MKLRLLLSFIAIMAIGQPLYAQQKHALIFAIGEYPEAGGWGKISSAQDVTYIKKALEGKGFPAANIKTVAEERATKEGIVSALKNLVNTVAKGDVVVIHFSSHGEQVADNNGDEVDGYDEAIVAYNASLIPSSVKAGATSRGNVLTKAEFDKLQVNYFRDDEFGVYIHQIRAKLGADGDVVVFMDNCHSGTGTRGAAKVRGGKSALTYEGHHPNVQKSEKAEVFGESTASRGNENDLAAYVVISAAQAAELNYETLGDDQVEMGSLTYAISKVFTTLKTGTTYRSLFAKIQAIMAEKVPGQHPVLEGNGLDRGVFSGKFEDQKPFIAVQKINSPLELVIAGGTFAGLSAGAKVNVHSEDVKDPAGIKPIAKGVVIKSNTYTATIKLDQDTKVSQPSLLRVFIADPVFIVKPIVVDFGPRARGTAAYYSTQELENIKAALKKIKLVNMVGTPELLIKKGQGADTLTVAANGYAFSTLKNAADTAELGEVIGRYAQYQFLREVKINDALVSAKFKFAQIKNGKPVQADLDAAFDDRNYEFMNGDSVVLVVQNTGKKNLYVNVLDLQPNGIINSIYPNNDLSIVPGDLLVKVGETRVFKDYVIEFTPPFGLELFKIFVSGKEINLEGLASPKTNIRAHLGVLEDLVRSSSTVKARGGGVVAPAETDGSVYNLFFTIKPRN